MAFFKDAYCQVCERFVPKKQWTKHFYSSMHLHRKVNEFWPAYFPRRKLTGDEGSTLEKAFWEMIFGSVDV